MDEKNNPQEQSGFRIAPPQVPEIKLTPAISLKEESVSWFYYVFSGMALLFMIFIVWFLVAEWNINTQPLKPEIQHASV